MKGATLTYRIRSIVGDHNPEKDEKNVGAGLDNWFFMIRPWRIEYEGAFYHMLSRGNARSDIYIDEKDRSSFLSAVGKMSGRFDIAIFAYVLMDNSDHLWIIWIPIEKN